MLAPMLFIAGMAVVLLAGIGLTQLFDPSLWVPKASGLGWTVNVANPHAWVVGALSVTWVLLLVLGLAGLSNPDAPVVGGLMQSALRLLGL